MTISSKRAEYVALASLILSVLFFGVALFIGRWSNFFAVSAVSWLILSAALIWFVLVIQFHQRSLAEQEKLDTSQLAEDEKASTIFQAKGERATLFAAAQRRLQILEKWFIPIFSAAIAAYESVIGLYLLKAVQAEPEVEPKQPLVCAILMTAVAFISFLISRYATGMSAQRQWKPLRAGGSFLLGVAIICFAMAIGLALVPFDFVIWLNVVNWVIPILLVVLGVETALNVILDIYRPRLKGRYARAAFDSRLLGLINEPGEILRTAASAIDYQFGFEVSQTWFYKLLEKAIVPLLLFAAITLYLSDCIVVIAPDEQAVIEHFGNPLDKAGVKRIAEPGLAFKWPWPIDKYAPLARGDDIVHKYPTEKISGISVGFVPDAQDDRPGHGPLLWGKKHYKEEHHLLVASGQTGGTSEDGAVPVSLVIAAVPVQYKIKDLYSFIYNHKEPEKLLECICYRELTKFAASARIEVDSEADLQHSLLGAGRAEAKKALTDNIQAAVDQADLGVEIVFVGVQGIHPPPDEEVAVAYQKVVGAVQEKQALVLEAHAERNKTLSGLVGSVKDADRLYELAAKYQRARENGQSDEIEALGRELDLAFAEAKGDIFSTLRQAQSHAFERATVAQATGQRFASQLKAYKAAPEIYKREQRLMVFEDTIGRDSVRKYVVVADPNDRQVFIFDFEEKLIPGLLDEIETLQETGKP